LAKELFILSRIKRMKNHLHSSFGILKRGRRGRWRIQLPHDLKEKGRGSIRSHSFEISLKKRL